MRSPQIKRLLTRKIMEMSAELLRLKSSKYRYCVGGMYWKSLDDVEEFIETMIREKTEEFPKKWEDMPERSRYHPHFDTSPRPQSMHYSG